MNLLLVIPGVLLLSDTVYTQNCALSALPPDSKSGCCGHSVTDGVTTSGTIARIDEYPWMGLVEYIKQGEIKLYCSAVLISGRYALSAGNCFPEAAVKQGISPEIGYLFWGYVVGSEDIILRLNGLLEQKICIKVSFVCNHSAPCRVNVRFGDYDLNNDGPDCVDTADQKICNNGALTIPIESFTVHPEYNKNRSLQNDITLIRLAKMVNYNDFIRPICLPSLDVTLKAPKNLYMTVAGWGAVNHTVTKSNVLRRVPVPYIDFYLCRHKYNESKHVLSSGQLCAGSKNRDACRGDSGGPLMLLKGSTTELAGIVSFGPYPCGKDDTPGVYTKVFAYNNWIKTRIAEDELSSTSDISPTDTPTTAKSVQPISASNDFYSDFIVFKE